MPFTRLPADFIERLRDLLCTVNTAQMFMRTSSESDRLARIVRLAVRQTDAAVGMLLLVDEDRGDLHVTAAVGGPLEALIGSYVSRTGVTGFAIDEGNPVAVADRPGDPRARETYEIDEIDERTGLETRNQLAVPLLVHGQVCGALELRNVPAERGFGPEHIELATELSYLAAAAVEEHRGERFLFALFASALPRALSPDRGREGDELAEEIQRWLGELQQSAAWRQQVGLAAKVRELCGFSHDAVGLADTILEGILARERARRQLLDS